MIFYSLRAFTRLIYPQFCPGCEEFLPRGQSSVCFSCLSKIEQTDFHLHEKNEITDRFFGHPLLKGAASLYYFDKQGTLQKIMHAFKYEGHKRIGISLGKYYGTILLDSGFLQGLDMLVPVPLHRSRRIKRGYNQSEELGRGISAVSGLPLNTRSLIRYRKTKTQTGKSLLLRWMNTQDIFRVTDIESIKSKNILLVDDIITTGSTLYSIIDTLSNFRPEKIKICAIGYTRSV